MTPGTVVLYRKFTFHDGDLSDKLLVVLNSGGKVSHLVLKTTSKQKAGRFAKEGCHAQAGYFFIRAQSDHFRKDTWVLLYETYELSSADFLKAHFGGVAEVVGCLKSETLRAIINCFKKTDDYSEHHESLLQ